MKLIDKGALIAEIEKRIKETEEHWKSPYGIETATGQGILMGYRDILSFINTLEVKDVNLERKIKNGIDNLSNIYCYMEDLFNGKEEEGVFPIPEKITNELFEFAKNFFEFGLKAQKGGE